MFSNSFFELEVKIWLIIIQKVMTKTSQQSNQKPISNLELVFHRMSSKVKYSKLYWLKIRYFEFPLETSSRWEEGWWLASWDVFAKTFRVGLLAQKMSSIKKPLEFTNYLLYILWMPFSYWAYKSLFYLPWSRRLISASRREYLLLIALSVYKQSCAHDLTSSYLFRV